MSDIKSEDINKFIDTFNISLGSNNYNLLELTSVGNDELKFSKILAWLFDEKAEHGYRNEFLIALFDVLKIEIERTLIEDYTVLTEYVGKESRIDICIYKPFSFLIYLENKTISGEGAEQLLREHNDMIRFKNKFQIPEKMCIPVFLTPTGIEPTTDIKNRWRTISLGELANIFLGVIGSPPYNKTEIFVRDLISWYRRMSGTQIIKFTKLDNALAKNHKYINKYYQAKLELQSRLINFVKDHIIRLEWWNDDWEIIKYNPAQIYIVKKEWTIDNEYVIWIGIENFNVESITYSSKSPANPIFYVWVKGGRMGLVEQLRDFLKHKDKKNNEILESNNSYIVKRELKKILSDDLINIKNLVGPKISDFFSHYIKYAKDFSIILNAYKQKNNL